MIWPIEIPQLIVYLKVAPGKLGSEIIYVLNKFVIGLAFDIVSNYLD